MGIKLSIRGIDDAGICQLLNINQSAIALYEEIEALTPDEGEDDYEFFERTHDLLNQNDDVAKFNDYKLFGLGRIRHNEPVGYTVDKQEIKLLLENVGYQHLQDKVPALSWA